MKALQKTRILWEVAAELRKKMGVANVAGIGSAHLPSPLATDLQTTCQKYPKLFSRVLGIVLEFRKWFQREIGSGGGGSGCDASGELRRLLDVISCETTNAVLLFDVTPAAAPLGPKSIK